jgi:hypothetical protein
MCSGKFVPNFYMCTLAAAGSVAHFVFIHHDVYYTWVTFAKGLRWVPSLSTGGAACAAGPAAFGAAAAEKHTRAFSPNSRSGKMAKTCFFFYSGDVRTRKSGQAETALGSK